MSELRCWQCGVEPYDVAEVTTIGEVEPRYIPARWPISDHAHALRPPTPEQLVDEGHRILRRILEDDS